MAEIAHEDYFRADAATAVVTKHFALPPYHVESFPGFGVQGWHCVCNVNGFNCLEWPGTGAKFTTLEAATIICDKWNKGIR